MLGVGMTTKGARHAITLIISHDQQDIWRTFGRHDGRRPVRLGIFRVFLDLAAELRRLRRKLLAFKGYRRAGRTWRARDLLGPSARRKRHAEENT